MRDLNVSLFYAKFFDMESDKAKWKNKTQCTACESERDAQQHWEKDIKWFCKIFKSIQTFCLFQLE